MNRYPKEKRLRVPAHHDAGMKCVEDLKTYHVKIYWAWLFRRLTSAGLPIGIPFCSYSIICMKFGSVGYSSAKSSPSRSAPGVYTPIVASIQTGWAPVNSAICFTSGK